MPRMQVMRVATIHAPGDIRLEDRPTPELTAPTDAVLKVVASCVCGSDLWPYRGENPIEPGSPIGHEMVGLVEDVGPEVTCLLYTSPSPRDGLLYRMPSSA